MGKQLVRPVMCVLIVGCFAGVHKDFFGIQMNEPADVNSFSISSYTESGINYQLSKSMNKDVCAFAKLSHSVLTIEVQNNSNYPISTNYFGDRFSLITDEADVYILEKGNITGYPSEYINPNSIAKYTLGLPTAICGIKKEAVSAVLCELGAGLQKTNVVLKPLPDRIEK